MLITCAGDFHADRDGYSRNLIVVAHPISRMPFTVVLRPLSDEIPYELS